MKSSELVRLYPRLFHMAADGSWPSIERHGLLSSAELVRVWESQSDTRGVLEQKRTSPVELKHPHFGTAVLRDQAPIHIPSLERALAGRMTVAEWLDALNSRVFFFLDPTSLFGMLRSPSYRRATHTVLTINTESFVAAHESEIQLTDMNTGFAQPHNHKARGPETFQPLAVFTHPTREHAHVVKGRDVVELCISGGVVDIVDHVLQVERFRQREYVDNVL